MTFPTASPLNVLRSVQFQMHKVLQRSLTEHSLSDLRQVVACK